MSHSDRGAVMIQGSGCQSQFRPCVHQSSKCLATYFSPGIVTKGKAFGIHFYVYLWYIAGSFLVFGHLFSSMSEIWLRSRNWLWDPDFLYWATSLIFLVIHPWLFSAGSTFNCPSILPLGMLCFMKHFCSSLQLRLPWLPCTPCWLL